MIERGELFCMDAMRTEVLLSVWSRLGELILFSAQFSSALIGQLR